MNGYLLFTLTTLSYLALAIFNLQKIAATGERLVGGGLLIFGLVAFYMVCSLALTINIATKGGFNWLSNTVFLRNFGIGILWLGMITGVAYAAILRPEWQTEPATGMTRMLLSLVYFGAAWLPLLMLLPYAILLNPEWQGTLSPNLYKVPLVLGCAIGFIIFLIPSIVSTTANIKAGKGGDESQWAFDNSMNVIRNDHGESIRDLLFFTQKGQDERLHQAALEKIKKHKDWEDQLLGILAQENYTDIYWAYAFLDANPIEHPERFIQPVNQSIPVLIAEIRETLKEPTKNNLGYIDIEAVCRVLDSRFKDHRAVFKPNVQQLQAVLEMTPAARVGDMDKQMFEETLNRYRSIVKRWLAAQ